MGTGDGIYDLLNTEVTARTRAGHNTSEEYGRLEYGVMTMSSFDLVSSKLVESREDNSGIFR